MPVMRITGQSKVAVTAHNISFSNSCFRVSVSTQLRILKICILIQSQFTTMRKINWRKILYPIRKNS